MAPPRRIDRPSRVELCIPESLHAKIKLELFSEAEGRVPKGRMSDLAIELLTDWLAKRGIS